MIAIGSESLRAIWIVIAHYRVEKAIERPVTAATLTSIWGCSAAARLASCPSASETVAVRGRHYDCAEGRAPSASVNDCGSWNAKDCASDCAMPDGRVVAENRFVRASATTDALGAPCRYCGLSRVNGHGDEAAVRQSENGDGSAQKRASESGAVDGAYDPEILTCESRQDQGTRG